MKAIKTNQTGHIHLIAIAVVFLLVVVAGGAYVYKANHRQSKVTDPTIRAELKKASSDLKDVNLASVKASVDSMKSTQDQFKQ